jgi:hypothetical protein
MSSPPNTRRAAPGLRLAVDALVWFGAAVGGLGLLARYASTGGAPAEAPHDWPTSSRLSLDAQRHTLVMIVHPQCPCSRASLVELNGLMGRLPGRIAAHVLLSTPDGFDEDFAHGPLFELASTIPDTEIVIDVGSPEADLFGAKTSGQTYLFSPEGDLLFAGGITPSRGHQGNSIGRQTIISLVTEAQAEQDVSQVFGCPMQSAADSKPISTVAAYQP